MQSLTRKRFAVMWNMWQNSTTRKFFRDVWGKKAPLAPLSSSLGPIQTLPYDHRSLFSLPILSLWFMALKPLLHHFLLHSPERRKKAYCLYFQRALRHSEILGAFQNKLEHFIFLNLQTEEKAASFIGLHAHRYSFLALRCITLHSSSAVSHFT